MKIFVFATGAAKSGSEPKDDEPNEVNIDPKADGSSPECK
jgi:hypothetical protein